MRFAISVLAALALLLGAVQAQAAQSCSSFVVFEKYDSEGSRVRVKHEKGNIKRFFPKPEGTPSDTSKVPGKCKKKVTKGTDFNVKATGGRLSMTQVRANYLPKMLNDPDDKEWLGEHIKKLIADETEVVAVIRPGTGKDKDMNITTIYMPANEEDLAEIKRLEDQAEEVE